MKKAISFLPLLFCVAISYAQINKIDSLKSLLKSAKQDSNSVTHLWQLSNEYKTSRPDTSLLLAEEALQLAKHINFEEGESKALSLLAASQYYLGNYPKALENYLLKLKIEEKRKIPKDYSVALNNIGLMYVLLGEHNNAIEYFFKADSVETANNLNYIKHRVMLNLGEAYFRKNDFTSSLSYFTKSLNIATANKSIEDSTMSLVGVANVLAKLNNTAASKSNYSIALQLLKTTNDEDLLCEASLGLAKVYDQLNKPDSAMYYAKLSYTYGKKDRFISREFDASQYLVELFKKAKKPDSAFAYLQHTVALKDSIMGQDKVRQAQIISSGEQLRQVQIVEQKKLAIAERKKQLQLLFIGIFIPLFFLLTLYISKTKIHSRIIKFLGIISLLLFFEYLTLLLHPFVAELTHHTPVLEMLIFVTIAAFLIPLHHRIEGILIKKLTSNKLPYITGPLKIKTKKIKGRK